MTTRRPARPSRDRRGSRRICVVGAACGEDLLQIYREAQTSDPAIASARARMGGDPGEGAAGARRRCCPRSPRRARPTDQQLRPDASTPIRRPMSRPNYSQGNLTFSASQPLYRPQNLVALDQAKQQVAQSDYLARVAQQDLIIRIAVAYFDVLLAEFNVELAKAAEDRRRRAARAGQAQLRGRNGDHHRHQRSAGEVRPDRRHGDPGAQRSRATGVRRSCARSSATCRRAEARRRGLRAAATRARTTSTTGWIDALQDNCRSASRSRTTKSRRSKWTGRKAGHYPTLDLVAKSTQQGELPARRDRTSSSNYARRR